jgi:methionyl-tRNA formyltransferase
MKILFNLMNQKGFSLLVNIVLRYGVQNIHGVVASRDKNVQNDHVLDIIAFCEENKITVFNKTNSYDDFVGYSIAVGWRWIIPKTDNLIIFHDSLLPKYRGFAPLPNMLINGEKNIGVTALFASGDFDTGDIISQKEIIIDYPIKILDAITEISKLYSDLAIEICNNIINNRELKRITQDHSVATYRVSLHSFT